ncbi:MAG: ABC transporter permease subunit [Thermoplasmata archaeon]|nr:ABC transporter permease subunit [Thermoplasmata archaeon]
MEPVVDVNISLRIEDIEIPEYAGATDANGQWIARNLTPAFHWLKVEDEENQSTGPFGQTQEAFTYIYVPHNSTVGYPVLGTEARNQDIRDSGNMKDVSVWVVGPDGSPAEGATVTVGELTNTTDSKGLTTFFKVPKGLHNVTAIDGALTGFTVVNVTHDRTETDPFAFALEGPDQVLRLVSAIAIGLVGPIYAIVLCFDSVFRERISGSLDYLLCRPMGRRAVLMGKFVGILGALMVPISAVSLMGVGVVTWQSGESPNTELVVGFIIYTVFLISIFVLLQMIFSTVAKTTGTAILSGIGMWIFFFMLFDLILLLVSYINGLEGDEQTIFFNRASFFNPISVYGMAIAQLGTDTSLMGVPDWAPSVAIVSYTLILLIAAMEIFRRRVTE